MKEEIFGPVLSVYVYPAGDTAKAVKLVNDTTPFALTGAIFVEDKYVDFFCISFILAFECREIVFVGLNCREVLKEWTSKLRYTAGNFYINDKSTGAVVGQQPFGGARHSGKISDLSFQYC